ncbi:MAG TPA: carboxypeptidase regulatory-like domain-containing protein [Terriglobia bacterium]|nr:carboxypeptidase regulatory-like domain-containing protein [Terriglobia bacterium]
MAHIDRSINYPSTFVLLVLFLVSISSFSFAQVNTAELHGIVNDPSGAMVADAEIKIQTLDTGFVRTVKTAPDGSYTFLALVPGHYSVQATAPGFSAIVVKEITLTIGQHAELPLKLELSPVLKAIEVLADTKLLEARRTSVTTTIAQRFIENLPINGRDYINFALLDSATTRENQPQLAPAPATGLNIGGQRARANMVSIDGVDAIDNTINGVRATVSQEAVQEFQILKTGYAAEFGRSSSAVINIVTKNGTNQWHGDIFGYLRNRHLEATNAFAGEPDPGDTQTQAGLTIGGPIRRDKTFLFFSFETTQRNSIGFSSIGRDQFGLTEIQDPFGGGMLLLTPEQATYIRSAPPTIAAPYTAVANNSARVALYGNTPGGPRSFGLLPNPLPASFRGLVTESGNYKSTEESYYYSVRIDHRFSSRHSAFLRVGVTPSNITGRTSNGQNQLEVQNSFSRTTNNSTRDLAVISQLQSSLSPVLLNEFRFQFARRGLGLTANGTNVAVEIPGVASIGQEPFAPVSRVEKRWQFMDSLSYVRGSHTLKTGMDVNRIPTHVTFPIYQSALYVFPATRLVDYPLIRAAVGSSLVDAWKATGAPAFSSLQAYGMGFPESFVQQFGGFDRARSDFTNSTLGTFVQDSWKIASNLQLNYGLRYDVEFMPLKSPSSTISEAGERLLGVVEGIPRDHNNLAPRIGLAWDPFKRGTTVVRSSYGLFFGHPPTGLKFLSDVVDGVQSPFLVAPQLLGADDLFQGRAVTPIGPSIVSPALGYDPSSQRYDPLSPAFSNQAAALALSPILPQTLPVAGNFQYDYTQQVALGFEHELSNNLSISADYSYIHGMHLLRPRNINQGDFNLIASYAQAQAVCPGLPGVSRNGCSSPIYQGAGGQLAGLWDDLGGNSPTSLASLGQLLFNQFRPTGPNYTWANAISRGALSKPVMDDLVRKFGLPHAPGDAVVPFFSVKQFESSGSSIYHALTLTLNKRFSRHYQLLGSYTWSHAIDDSTDLATFEEPQDNQNAKLDRGNSSFDQRHRFVLSGVLESPWGVTRDNLLDAVLDNWTLSPRFEVGSGRPYLLLTNNDRTLINSGQTARPDVVPAGTLGSYLSPDGKVGLALPPVGSVGNLGRNIYRTGAFSTVDFRLSRKISLGSSWKLYLTADVFNLFNRVNISKTDTTFTNSGIPVSAFNPRQIQVSMSLSF